MLGRLMTREEQSKIIRSPKMVHFSNGFCHPTPSTVNPEKHFFLAGEKFRAGEISASQAVLQVKILEIKLKTTESEDVGVGKEQANNYLCYFIYPIVSNIS